MASLIDDLLAQALSDSVPVESLLRRVCAAATLLDLREPVEWAENELYGYAKEQPVPSYRNITGELHGWNPFHGWLPVTWQDPNDRKNFPAWPMRDSISEIWDRIERRDQSSWELPLGPLKLRGALGIEPTNTALIIDRAQFVNVVSIVRSKIVDWAIKLKKAGVMGERLSFSEQEKKKAHEQVPMIHIERVTGNVVGAMSGNANASLQ